VSPVRFELGFYIPEDDILHSHRRENLKSYLLLKRSRCIDTLIQLHWIVHSEMVLLS
jgi:hypothetical protein